MPKRYSGVKGKRQGDDTLLHLPVGRDIGASLLDREAWLFDSYTIVPMARVAIAKGSQRKDLAGGVPENRPAFTMPL